MVPLRQTIPLEFKFILLLVLIFVKLKERCLSY